MTLAWSKCQRKRMATWLGFGFRSNLTSSSSAVQRSALDLYQQERGKGKAKREYTIARTSEYTTGQATRKK